MDVRVVTKVGCPRCLLLKDKLKRLGVEHKEVGDGELVEVTNKDALDNMNFPITIIDGVAYGYSEALAKLKGVSGA